MAEQIGPDHGLEARRVQENKLHPNLNAWNISSKTFKTLVSNSNEYANDIAKLKQEVVDLQQIKKVLLSRPF